MRTGARERQTTGVRRKAKNRQARYLLHFSYDAACQVVPVFSEVETHFGGAAWAISTLIKCGKE